jgi:hypothetical protein
MRLLTAMLIGYPLTGMISYLFTIISCSIRRGRAPWVAADGQGYRAAFRRYAWAVWTWPWTYGRWEG